MFNVQVERAVHFAAGLWQRLTGQYCGKIQVRRRHIGSLLGGCQFFEVKRFAPMERVGGWTSVVSCEEISDSYQVSCFVLS